MRFHGGGSDSLSLPQFRRSFSEQSRANYVREADTDARQVANSQQVAELSCRGRGTLDQESPGSSPGGAIAGARAPAVFFGARPSAAIPGGATESAASDFPVAALSPTWPLASHSARSGRTSHAGPRAICSVGSSV